MNELFVNWQKNYSDSTWYRLLEINPIEIAGAGVYLIWHAGHNPRMVYIGHCVIYQRLMKHQQDSRILEYGSKGTLLTTWGTLDIQFREGVERYVINTYRPLVNERMPNVQPISVNLLA